LGLAEGLGTRKPGFAGPFVSPVSRLACGNSPGFATFHRFRAHLAAPCPPLCLAEGFPTRKAGFPRPFVSFGFRAAWQPPTGDERPHVVSFLLDNGAGFVYLHIWGEETCDEWMGSMLRCMVLAFGLGLLGTAHAVGFSPCLVSVSEVDEANYLVSEQADAFSLKNTKIYNTSGTLLGEGEILRKVKPGTQVLIARMGDKISLTFLFSIKKDTLVLVMPSNREIPMLLQPSESFLEVIIDIFDGLIPWFLDAWEDFFS
jgi:hypothetical protein